MRRLRQTLDRFYRTYDFSSRMAFDPVSFPHRYTDPRDIEISGFIASCFAYGRADLFKLPVEKVLSAMGESPYSFVRQLNIKQCRKLFSGIKYRFNENEDILALLHILNTVLKKYSTLEQVFKKHYGPEHATIKQGLAGMVATFMNTHTSAVYGSNIKPKGLLQFLPSPLDGSPCKRANLFLRWMIRDRDIDFGIWKDIPLDRLVIPLDTHIARISQCLGLTSRKTQDWTMAEEITASLRLLDPSDPLKYDFALCHHGISGICNSQRNACTGCALRQICVN